MHGHPTLFEQPRLCKPCGTLKQPGEFYPSTPWRCKACVYERSKARYEANRELILRQFRDYAQNNRDVNRAASKRYRRKHSDAVRERARKRYRRDLELSRARAREQSHRRRARVAAATVAKLDARTLLAKWEMWGGVCWICRHEAASQWDHVKPLAANGPHILANLRPACARCNRQKSSTWPFDVRTVRDAPHL